LSSSFNWLSSPRTRYRGDTSDDIINNNDDDDDDDDDDGSCFSNCRLELVA